MNKNSDFLQCWRLELARVCDKKESLWQCDATFELLTVEALDSN